MIACCSMFSLILTAIWAACFGSLLTMFVIRHDLKKRP